MRRLQLRRKSTLAAILVLSAGVTAAAQAAQGIYSEEVVIGTHVDLSGPLNSWGSAVRNGIEMAFAEANEAGGVNNRMVRLIAKDDGYDSDRAAEAVRELVEADRVFAILSPLGTPTTHVAASESLDRDVLYLFPLTAAEQPLESQSPSLFTLVQSAEDEIADSLRRMLEIKPGANVGVLASDDALGTAVRGGVNRQLSASVLERAADVTFARGVNDFSIPLRWLRERDVGLIVLGAVGEDVIAIMQAARAMRWQPTFLCTSSCYTPELAALGGEIVEGLYAVGQIPIPYPNDRLLGSWAQKYETAFGSVATKQALAAYRNARLFLTVLQRTGRTPTQANFRHALESLGPWTDPLIDIAPVTFSETDHTGGYSGFLAQARNGRWAIIPQVSPTRL